MKSAHPALMPTFAQKQNPKSLLPTVSMAKAAAFLLLAALLLGGSYFTSSASFSDKVSKGADPVSAPAAKAPAKDLARPGELSSAPALNALFGAPRSSALPIPVPPSPVTVATYASDCSTPKTVFNLQDADKTVCAKVTGADPSWQVIWSNANSVAVQNVPVGSGTSTFTLTASSSLGDWRVILFEPFGGSVQAVTSFTVIDAANPSADVSISKGMISDNVSAGSQVLFALQVSNSGPSDAATVALSDSVPANTTFVSLAQLSGPVFDCTNPTAGSNAGSSVCTISSLSRSDTAVFVATYQVDAVPNGTLISNTASISSTTFDPSVGDPTRVDNNSATAEVQVIGATCQLSSPDNITVSADTGQSGAVVTYTTPTSTGDCGQASTGEGGETIPVISCNPASGSFFPAGTSTVICVAQAGTAVSFQVTVNNPGALSISLNGANPLTVECGTDFNDPGAAAVDGTGQSVPVTVTLPQGFNPDAPTVGSYTLTYTATQDPNSASTTRTVNVVDSEAPSITIGGANPFKLQLGSCPFIDPGVSATDGCQGAVTVSSSVSGPNGATAIDPNVAGTYVVTYSASDTAATPHTTTATRTVLVGNFPPDEVDQGNPSGLPTITLTGAAQISIECGNTFNDPGATAVVGCASVSVTTSGTVDIHTPGDYTITYSATSASGTVSTTRLVTVGPDNSPPTITVTGANPLQVECHGTFVDPGAVAHDACAGDFAATASGTVDPNTVGQYIVTYNATDPSGHTAAPVTRTVNVVDTTAPIVTAPANVTVFTGSGAASCSATVSDATLGAASATDSCQGALSTTRSGVPAGNVFVAGTTTITYSATDASNNTSTAVQTVTVIDNTPPTITLNGANPVTVECHTSFTDPGATAHDNCSANFAATATSTVNVNAVGSYTVTYNAHDAAGNNATAVTRTVNVVDTIAPTITLNGANPMTVECHTSFTDPGATANDTCAGNLTSGIVATGTVNANVVGSYTRTYTVSDGHGHTSVATRTVNVVDTTVPTTTFTNLTIFLNNLTIVFNTNSYTVNGVSHPYNGVSCTHEGTTFSFNGQTVSITIAGHTVSYTFSGNTLVLWTPTHQYQTVKVADLISSAADSCDTTIGLSNVVIQKVSSDEPQDIAGGGDGNTLNDIVIAPDCKSVQLRAERNGSGNGRVYTITFRVRDQSGNTTTTTSKLKIFANSLNVVDDGAAAGYTVNSSCP